MKQGPSFARFSYAPIRFFPCQQSTDSAAFLKGDTIGEEKVTEKGIEPCPNMCKHEQRRTSRKNARSVNWPRAITRQPIGSFMPKWSSRVGQERRLRRSQLNWIAIPKRCVSTWHGSILRGLRDCACKQEQAASHV